MGLHRAGFDVTGVDLAPQPRYPFRFIQADALTYPLEGFDLIWASPPCQGYTQLGSQDGRHPRLIDPIRERLAASGSPYVIENVVGAPLRNPVQLCGSMFGLNVRRHRRFETTWPVSSPPCRHGGTIRAYYGKPGALVWQGKRHAIYRGTVEQAPADMGIDWMTWNELREAIPPAYSEFLARALLRQRAAT